MIQHNRCEKSLFGRCGGLYVTLVVLAGCGNKYDASVSGHVTLDGRPLKRGQVAFHAREGGAVAYGEIESDGTYELRTGGTRGLSPGTYIATVVALEENLPEPGQPTFPGNPITPPEYAHIGTSDLKFEVSEGSNRIDLELLSK